MYPNEVFLGMDLYSILITVGVIACMVLIRVLSDKKGLGATWQNFLLATTVGAVVLGYGAAVLMQGLYNIQRLGRFELTNSTGSTFYGGLLGGAAVFLAIYFGVGHFLFKDGYHKAHTNDLLDIAACCITMAHGFGRLGCLMAGCCYGTATDAWYGIYMVHLGHKVIPVQLYEAIFLFLLSALLIYRYLKGKTYNMATYMLVYGLWRFFVEYLRDDERGNTIVSFLTPSQLISVVLVLGAVGIYFVQRYLHCRTPAPAIHETPDGAPVDASPSRPASSDATDGTHP